MLLDIRSRDQDGKCIKMTVPEISHPTGGDLKFPGIIIRHELLGNATIKKTPITASPGLGIKFLDP